MNDHIVVQECAKYPLYRIYAETGNETFASIHGIFTIDELQSLVDEMIDADLAANSINHPEEDI